MQINVAARSLVSASGSFATEYTIIQYSSYERQTETIININAQKFVGANAQADAILALDTISTGFPFQSNNTATYQVVVLNALFNEIRRCYVHLLWT